MGEEAFIAFDRKVPISRTLVKSYATLFANLWPFLQIALFPLALGVLLPYLWDRLYGPMFDSLVPLLGYDTAIWVDSLNPQWIFERMTAWLTLVLFMSHWLQFLGAKEAGRKPAIVWIFARTDRYVLRVGLLLLVVPLGSVLARLISSALAGGTVEGSLPFGATPLQSSLILLIPATVAVEALVAGRCAPVFAAAADGQPMTLQQAWRTTRGQTLRLMFLWIVLYWVTGLLGVPLQAVVNHLYVSLIVALHAPGESVGWFYAAPAEQLVHLPRAAVDCAAMALGACLFRQVYRRDAAARKAVLERFD